MVTCGKEAVLRVSIPTLLTKIVVSSALRFVVKSAEIVRSMDNVIVLIFANISMKEKSYKFPSVGTAFFMACNFLEI